MTTIAIDPSNPNVIYAGSPGELGNAGAGVWKTTDGGHTWMPTADNLPVPTLSIAAIAIDPTNSNRLYLASTSDGIFRSDDAGNSWSQASDALPIVSATGDGAGERAFLRISPTSPNELYLSTNVGVQCSVDFGHTWSASGFSWTPDPGTTPAFSIVMDPLDPHVLYAGIMGVGVYKTTDADNACHATWQLQNQQPLPTVLDNYGPLLAISHTLPDANATVYALFRDEVGSVPTWQLFRTTDGTNWSNPLFSQCNGPSPCTFFTALGVDPVDRDLVAMGGPLLRISQNGGGAFTTIPATGNDRQPDSPHGDYWELNFDPTNHQILYAGSDGGIFRSDNRGLPYADGSGSWTFIGAGIANVEMYDIALARTDPGLILAGTQDNGNILYTGSSAWDHIPHSQTTGGDGAAVAIDPTNANVLYLMGQLQDSLSQSLNRGQDDPTSFAAGLPHHPLKYCGVFNSTFHFQVHPSAPTPLLASCGDLYRTTSNTSPGDWISILAGVGSVVRSAIEAADDVYYAGTSAGDVFALTGDLTQQLYVFHHSRGQNVMDIEVDAAHTGTVYVAFAPPTTEGRDCPVNAGTGRVIRLERTQPFPDLAMTPQDITNDLPPGLCVNALAIDPFIPRTLYAATNKGVYRGRSNATGGPWVWQSYNNGLPPADVRDLEVHPTTGHIFAATYGRSAFEVIPERTLEVSIDIKPGSSVNPVNPASHGKTPVAILSSPTFDAPNEVDRKSVTFGRTGDETSLQDCSDVPQDVNGDGLLDQVCRFSTAAGGFQAGDTVGILKGLTRDGAPIKGSDAVAIVPPRL
ncbi:MAG: hypothetical protein ACM3SQ_14515 [Betaproteobacteria bacterium]